MTISAVLLLHVVLAIAAGLWGRRLGRAVLLLVAAGPATGLVYAATVTPVVLAGEAQRATIAWAPGLGLSLDLRLDGFGLLFWWVIAGIGLLVMLYAHRYFSPRRDLGRFAATLVVFAGAMLLLTAADNVLLLFVAWELTSITSYLLIGFDDEKAAARSAALQALLVTGLGGLALLGGLVLLGQDAGTYSLQGILAAAPGGDVTGIGLVLVLLAAATKSAQAPFHFWLPGAMAAPTPVSAYLHSATMVKAGLYLVARLAPAFGPTVDWWTPVVVAVGSVTLLIGGWRALQATDLKALLAYGTVSQLGFIMVLVGFGDPQLTHAGVAVLLAHALLKATLFLTVGVVDHQAHQRDLRRLTGLARRMPMTAVAAGIAVASMAGIIPLFGFVAKETALKAALASGGIVVTSVIVLGAVLTMAYGMRFVWGAFATKSEDQLDDSAVRAGEVPPPARSLEMPAVVLTVATVLLGVWVAPADALVGAAAAALDAGAADSFLKLWQGFTTALYLSLLALALGATLFLVPDLVSAGARLTSRAPDMTELYRRSLSGLSGLADRTVAVVQPGSLPIYLGIILATVVALPGAWVVAGFRLPADLVIASSPLQAAVSAVVIGAALGMAVARRRLSAVLLLGGVGFGMAVLFVIQGAPDLALTQLLVETLTLGIFVLVLRRLPEEFSQSSWRLGRVLRVVLSVTVALFMGAFSLMAASVRQGDTQAAEFLSRALPEGGGRNVVNVILTDFRALDTLGEVTVLAIAAIGVVHLVRGIAEHPQGRSGESTQAAAGRQPPSLVLNTVLDVIFRTGVAFSVFLLFAGHNAPGGGFIGGLVAGAALVLRYIAGGVDEVDRVVRVRTWAFLGGGLLLATGTGIAGWAWGSSFLESAQLEVQVPLLGTLKATTALPFDIGVYVVVVGLALAVLRSLGAEADEVASADAAVDTVGAGVGGES